jgi:hypothetical protein
MKKYQILVDVLDQIRREAPQQYRSYRPIESDLDKVNQARAKAFIHLFLKVQFGILDFEERHAHITDGPNDGGIDAYYIDEDNKTIYFVQSKFRTTGSNFDGKTLDLEELLKMDVDRITKGTTADEHGVKYNSKIQALIGRIQELETPRYEFRIILLANLKPISSSRLRKLVGDFRCEIFDHSRCYEELIFPVVTGTHYKASDLLINMDLSNKPHSQSRIRYPVAAGSLECEITVLFVPTIEIAEILYKYRNSILRFNPRSYLGLSGNLVNAEIRKTIVEGNGNEFSLFNNGITMLSDETRFSERTGRQYQGQLLVKNPQIINGGQTAYTLSMIYEDTLDNKLGQDVFDSKEVLLRVITFVDAEDMDDDARLELIEAISKATNQQTVVTEADRRSNDKVQITLQNRIYREFGYFYERKKGEFYDGLRQGYISDDRIIDRVTFLRVCNAIDGRPDIARGLSARNLFREQGLYGVLHDVSNYREMLFSYLCFKRLEELERQYGKDPNNRFGVVHFGNALRYGKFAVVAVAHSALHEEVTASNVDELSRRIVDDALGQWLDFEDYAKRQPPNRRFFRRISNPETGEETLEVDFNRYYKARNLRRDLEDFFGSRKGHYP